MIYHHPTRKSVGYFAAVRLRDGLLFVCRETDDSTGSRFSSFFRHFLQQTSAVDGRRIVAISDNAAYHRATLHKAWREKQSPLFELDFLPPYSPQLNPIERVWKLTRRLCLHNRYFGFLDGVVEAVEEQFAEWAKSNETLRRICAIT